jgi:hypothetical protein
VLKYDEALSDVIYHVDNLKSQIDESEEEISWLLYKN